MSCHLAVSSCSLITTQLVALGALGIRCKNLRFPGEYALSSLLGRSPLIIASRTERTTETGKIINAYLTNQKELEDHVIHLLYSANRWEVR